MEINPPTISDQTIRILREQIKRIPISISEYQVAFPNGTVYTGMHISYFVEVIGEKCRIHGSSKEIEAIRNEIDEDFIKSNEITIKECELVIEIPEDRGIKYRHSAVLECPISCLEEFYGNSFVYPPQPGGKIFIGIKRKQDGLKTWGYRPQLLYRYDDRPEALASAAFTAWDRAVRESVLLEMGGKKSITNMSYQKIIYKEEDIRIDHETSYEIVSPKLNQVYEQYDSIYRGEFNERKWSIENRSAIAIQEVIREHVRDYLLPTIFYDLAEKNLLLYFSEKWGTKKGKFDSQALEIDLPTRFILKIMGIDSQDLKVPQGTTEKFLNNLESIFQKDIITARKRKERTEGISMEARIKIIESFVKSIRSRSRTRELEEGSKNFKTKEWMELHFETVCKMLEEYQAKHPKEHFHIDHIVPLVALPDHIAGDLMSHAWHPCNLSIVSEEVNLSKSSSFNGKRITKENKTEQDEDQAVKHLKDLYDCYGCIKGIPKITYSD